MKNGIYIVCISLIFALAGCEKTEETEVPVDPFEVQWDFDENTENWRGDFSDYPEGEEEFYELDFEQSTLPPPLSTSEGALKISGNNHSDDLFMFVYHRVENLFPNSDYQVFFDLTLASDAAEDSFGVGGSPANSVYLKAGALNYKPFKEVGDQGYYWLNLDKGNQSQDGSNMVNIGNISNGTDEFVYTLIDRSNDAPFEFRTGPEGNAWIIIGTDSGFEGLTTLYYDRIKVTFDAVE